MSDSEVALTDVDSSITRVAEPDLHVILREEMSARGWGIQQLADQVGVRYGVAARWVTEERTKRVVPQPRTLVELARLFNLPLVEVFQHAGYLPSVTDGYDADEERIQGLVRRLRRMLRNVPLGHREIAFGVAAVVLDQLQAIIERFIDGFGD